VRQQCGARQVPAARHALSHNIGLGGAAVVTLYRLGFPRQFRAFSGAVNPALVAEDVPAAKLWFDSFFFLFWRAAIETEYAGNTCIFLLLLLIMFIFDIQLSSYGNLVPQEVQNSTDADARLAPHEPQKLLTAGAAVVVVVVVVVGVCRSSMIRTFLPPIAQKHTPWPPNTAANKHI
jgi:hypothetical protein